MMLSKKNIESASKFYLESLALLKELKTDKRLKIGILSNLSYNSGVDRVIEIYECIPLKLREKFLSIISIVSSVKSSTVPWVSLSLNS